MRFDVQIRVLSGCLAVAAAVSAGVCQAQIGLVGQGNPFPDQEFYADVWGAGDFAYVGSWGGSGATGVLIYDITDPTTPNLVATYNGGPAGRPYQDVKVADGIGYFALDDSSNEGTDIVDLSNPANPMLLVRLSQGAHSSLPDVHNVFLHAGFLYQADGVSATVAVFDVSMPAAPAFVRDIDTPGAGSGGVIHDITVLGGRLCAADIGLGATYIYDVTNVATQSPPLLGTIPLIPSSHSCWFSADGTILVNAEERAGGDVTLWNISDPGLPTLLATIDATFLGINASSPHNPILVGDLLYISWYEAGLQLLDVSDPSNPQDLGGFDTFPGPTGNLDGNWGVYPLLGEDRVLLSDLESGLLIVDVRPVTGLIFGDGFESGDLLSWSATAPLGF